MPENNLNIQNDRSCQNNNGILGGMFGGNDCGNSTKLLLRRNGTNVEERVNIENNLNLVYNIDYVI